MTVVSIGVDPDVRQLGWAIDIDGELVDCGAVSHQHKKSGWTHDVAAHMCGEVLSDWVNQGEVPCVFGYGPRINIAVEGQQIITHGDNPTKNPANILSLAYVSGAALHILLHHCRRLSTSVWGCIPTPKEWKGQAPKHVSQARAFRHYGMSYVTAGGRNPYCVPTDDKWTGKLPKKSMWADVADAVAMAKWASENGKY